MNIIMVENECKIHWDEVLRVVDGEIANSVSPVAVRSKTKFRMCL